MNLILTSDFPSTANARVVECMRAVGRNPRIGWIPPHTDHEGASFSAARERFGALGFTQLESVDIDEDCDPVQIAYLHEFDIIYLAGGDPVRFRYNALRSGLSGRLRPCLTAGRLVIGTSGGAMLMTPNVSVFRLRQESAADVLATRPRFEALGAVGYELLPHSNRCDPAFSSKVLAYSAGIDHDIIGLPDDGAILQDGSRIIEMLGAITRYRNGHIIESGVET